MYENKNESKMYKEVGSEFHKMELDAGRGIFFPGVGSFTFSGRTAMETVLKKLPHIETALLPSYCCDSMIEPFRRAGISVDFFDVEYDGTLRYEINKSADMLLWCNYFGFKNEMPDFNGIIVEDITHSLLSDISHHMRSNFLVASVRKWEPLYCGGYCSVTTDSIEPPGEFVENKSRAMELKTQYLVDGDEDKKAEYLSLFRKSNEWLANNYSGLGMDHYSREYLTSVDIERHKEIRRRNARILYEGLQGKVDFLFPLDQMDCPLFVPIVCANAAERNKLRNKLTAERIYCPVHWPHPNADCQSNLYEIELSLICDQRYNEDDMERIVSVLSEI